MRRTTGARPQGQLRLILGIVLFLASAYFYQDPEWNGNSRLDLTRAIVERGELSIDAYHDSAGWFTGDKAIYGGHYYSDKAPGASFLAVPIYFLVHHVANALGIDPSASTIKHILTLAVMGTAFVIAGLAMYTIALVIHGDSLRAFLATLAIALGTMLWPYSAVFYGHLPAAASLIVAFALLVSATRRRDLGDGGRWLWIGFAASMAFISDYTSAVVIVVLAMYALFVLRGLSLSDKLRAAWRAIPGLLAPLVVFAAYNLAIYGRPVAFGYAFEAEQRFQEIMALGLMGIRGPALGASFHITADPAFGILWLSPLLLLAPAGYLVAFSKRAWRAEALASGCAILFIFLVNAGSFLWYGGSAFGPRLMISALPFFIVPLALLPRRWSFGLTVLTILSALNMLIPLTGEIQYSRLEFKPDQGGFFVAGRPFHGFSLLYEYGLPRAIALARDGRSPWTMGGALGLPLGLSVGLFVALEAALSLWFLRVWQQSSSGAFPRTVTS